MKSDNYNWIDDPFDEKKNREIEQQAMAGSSRTALGLGCIVAIVLIIVMIVLSVGLLQAISAS